MLTSKDLLSLCKKGKESTVITYLKGKPGNITSAINVSDENGLTMLMWAAQTANTELLDTLTQAGANINLTDKQHRNALMHAVLKEDREEARTAIVEKLLSLGANINARDNSNTSALLIALMNRHYNIARLLIAGGSDLTAISKVCNTSALHYAKSNCSEDVYAMMLEKLAGQGLSADKEITKSEDRQRLGFWGRLEKKLFQSRLIVLYSLLFALPSAGLFYASYTLSSNTVLDGIGFRFSFARILFAFGIISALLFFTCLFKFKKLFAIFCITGLVSIVFIPIIILPFAAATENTFYNAEFQRYDSQFLSIIDDKALKVEDAPMKVGSVVVLDITTPGKPRYVTVGALGFNITTSHNDVETIITLKYDTDENSVRHCAIRVIDVADRKVIFEDSMSGKLESYIHIVNGMADKEPHSRANNENVTDDEALKYIHDEK